MPTSAPARCVLTQAGGVLNLGQASANTGQNQAFGNNSTNTINLTQNSFITSIPAPSGPAARSAPSPASRRQRPWNTLLKEGVPSRTHG